MRLVIDTNVLISGIIYSGPPSQILDAWRDGQFRLLISFEILDEYRRIGEKFVSIYHKGGASEFINLVMSEAETVDPAILPHQICSDSTDDKFLACAMAGGAEFIISGDRALLKCSGYRGITVLTPREFVEKFLPSA